MPKASRYYKNLILDILRVNRLHVLRFIGQLRCALMNSQLTTDKI